MERIYTFVDRLVRGRRSGGYILEVQTSVISFAWGILILLPELGVTDQATYKTFVLFASKWAWGLVFLVYGAVYFVAAWKRDFIRLRRACALFGAVLFSVVTYLFFSTFSVAYLGLVTYSVMAVTNALVFFRLRDKIRV